ncbi:SurA N-terminal domain-containing protein [Oleidesulfovibrio sp.]|uniref:SurA N-terminal domain-containing protein n=1 Tax=Oleidesulfovibrio sp. TaxID=2909707 RepID=UPI003A835E0C
MLRLFKYCIVIVLLLMAAVPQASAESVINKIVAVVNGDIITKYDLQARASSKLHRAGLSALDPADAKAIRQIEAETLEEMIVDQLMVQEAKRYNLLADEVAIDNELRSLLARMQISQEELEARLRTEGQDIDFYRGLIANNIMRQKLLSFMVSRKVVVTRQDIEAYYNEHKSEYMQDKSVALSLIVFAPNTDAAAVLQDVRDGKMSFAEAVEKYSIGPSVGGGSIGTLEWSSLIGSWRQSIEGVPAGGIGSEIEYDGRAAYLHVDNVTEGSAKPVDGVAEEIEEKLREPLLKERFEEYTRKLRERAVVDIRL